MKCVFIQKTFVLLKFLLWHFPKLATRQEGKTTTFNHIRRKNLRCVVLLSESSRWLTSLSLGSMLRSQLKSGNKRKEHQTTLFFFPSPVEFRELAGHLSVAKLSRKRFTHFDECLQQLTNTKKTKKPFSFSRRKRKQSKKDRRTCIRFFENIVVYSSLALQPNCLFPLSFSLFF